MTDKSELLEKTPQELIEIIFAQRSDTKDLKGQLRAQEVLLVAERLKVEEMDATMRSGAMKLIKYKKLQDEMQGIEKENSELQKKIDELEEVNGTMIASIPLQEQEIEQLKIRNKDLVRKNASKEEALASLRDTYEKETDECAKNKEKIHSSMQETIDDCKARIKELNNEEARDKTIIADFTNKLGNLKKQVLGLRQIEAEQKTAIMNANQRHMHDQESMRTIKDTLNDELNKSKGEVKELRERLKSTQDNLERAIRVVYERPKSPVAKIKEQEKAPADEKRFLAIGNKTAGRKSPLGGGPSLNPKELARKIKYRF
jgi:chromosome segregation ATPase